MKQHPERLVDALRKRESAVAPLRPVDLLAWHRNQTLYQRDVKGHTGCVNALEFSRDENYLLSGGDDCEVWLWESTQLISQPQAKPRRVMQGKHYSNIFSLAFSCDGYEAYSAGNDATFLAHDIETGKTSYRMEAHHPIHRIDAHPSLNNVASIASEDHHLYVVDTRTKEENKYNLKQILYSAMFNPREPDLLCVATNRSGVHVYDLRSMHEPVTKLKQSASNCTYARWSPNGEAIAAVVTRGDILYYRCLEPTYTSLTDPEFFNACTMKSCTFIDNDTLLCGSDHWDIYAWKVPSSATVEKVEHCYAKLEGHRSIVNHIRYSAKNNVIVSSGVEKIIKCWSCYELEGSVRDPVRRLLGYPRHILDYYGRDSSADEDLNTLYQFDSYLLNANNPRFVLGDFYDESDDDEEAAHEMHNLLQVAILGFENDAIAESDSDENMSTHEVESEVESDSDSDGDGVNRVVDPDSSSSNSDDEVET